MRRQDQQEAEETISRDPVDANFIKPLDCRKMSIKTRSQNLCHNRENPSCGNPNVTVKVEPGMGDSDNVSSGSYAGLDYNPYNYNPDANCNNFCLNDAVLLKVEPGLDRFADFTVPVLAPNVNPNQSNPSFYCKDSVGVPTFAPNVNPSQNNPSFYHEDTVGVKVGGEGGGSDGQFCVPVYNRIKTEPGDDVDEIKASLSISAAAATTTTDVCYSLRTRQVYRPINKQIRRRRRV